MQLFAACCFSWVHKDFTLRLRSVPRFSPWYIVRRIFSDVYVTRVSIPERPYYFPKACDLTQFRFLPFFFFSSLLKIVIQQTNNYLPTIGLRLIKITRSLALEISAEKKSGRVYKFKSDKKWMIYISDHLIDCNKYVKINCISFKAF